jgi:Protein of unknown function (DUF2877)
MATVTTTPTVAFRASVPIRMRQALSGPSCRGRVLVRFPSAVYVAVPHAFGVIAVLGRDAVRLPCGLAVPVANLDLPGDVVMGGGVLRLGDVLIRPGRLVSALVARRATPLRARVRAAQAAVDPADVTDPGQLLGRGPGLTPEGDDVLAGYLAGAAAYGIPADDMRALVNSEAASRTTTLSAALLRHAAAGEAIPQVDGLLDALDGRRPLDPALAELFAVGHTSGAALASGVVAAATAA